MWNSWILLLLNIVWQHRVETPSPFLFLCRGKTSIQVRFCAGVCNRFRANRFGRIMRYNRWTNKVIVLRSGVRYPNGITISADWRHLIVALTRPCKLMRYWIRGSKAGTSERAVFWTTGAIPGQCEKGGYWVALHREKYELPFGSRSLSCH